MRSGSMGQCDSTVLHGAQRTRPASSRRRSVRGYVSASAWRRQRDSASDGRPLPHQPRLPAVSVAAPQAVARAPAVRINMTSSCHLSCTPLQLPDQRVHRATAIGTECPGPLWRPATALSWTRRRTQHPALARVRPPRCARRTHVHMERAASHGVCRGRQRAESHERPERALWN